MEAVQDASASLPDFLVESAPKSLYYWSNFITESEENTLLNKVYSAPQPKWTTLKNRRLQNWGGLPHPKGMIAEDLPQWLSSFTEKLDKLNVYDGKCANHVLVNEYNPGQGIMAHEDGPLFYPAVATVSLGSHCVLNIYSHRDSNLTSSSVSDGREPLFSVFLEPRSLIVLKDSMYTSHLHEILETSSDDTSKMNIVNKVVLSDSYRQATETGATIERSKRVSLTIRHVPKILKNKLLFGKRL